MRSAARSVPSATHTWPAWSERPMPTPPPWWKETHEAPVAVLTSALRIGQSATASEPSRIASVSRWGEATEPGVEVVAADHDRRLHLAARDQLVEPAARRGGARRSRASRSAPAAPGRRPARGRARSSGGCGPGRRTARGSRRRSRRCRPGRRTAPPSGTAPCPRRTAAGCRRGRSRGRRTRPRRRAPPRRRAARCRSRRPRRPARRACGWRRRARARTGRRGPGSRPGPRRAARRPARA